MPPPSDCSKISSQSTNDHETDNDFNNPKSDLSDSVQENTNRDIKTTIKDEAVGFVKTLLGPSLEDAVLKTLEFGKALVKKPDGSDSVVKEKKLVKTHKKGFLDCYQRELNGNFEKKVADIEEEKYFNEGTLRKSIMYDKEKDKTVSTYQKCKKPPKKLANVSKIRSLDSDLKEKCLSPEKIKRQLEALIQINKDVPPEHTFNWNYCPKKSEMPVEVTVMPSICVCDKKALKSSSFYEEKSNPSKLYCNGDPTTSRTSTKKLIQNKICHAPEFISNALGPTIDVSLIDNIKMMRDIFKSGDSAKNEEIPKPVTISQPVKQEVRFQDSETEMTFRIDELQKKIEELEQKERCLAKQIEDEERERDMRRQAFKEEERRLDSMKTCFDEMVAEKKKECHASQTIQTPKTPPTDRCMENKYDALKTRIACEEEKLTRLKFQSENYKREINEAKVRREALKKSKDLLDAWDVFASRVCHTRLPSFSKVHTLERKDYKAGDTGNLHCCFPVINPPAPEKTKSCKSTSRQIGSDDCQNLSTTQCSRKKASRCASQNSCCGSSKTDISHGCKDYVKNESLPNIKCKLKAGEIQFPVQRDITCGLHQVIKLCSCKQQKSPMKHEGHVCSSADDLHKRCKTMEVLRKEHFCNSSGLESSTELVMKKRSKEKVLCRSKSDTSLKKDKCSRIVKVMWATTRINIFQDNCRTYEIMDATPNAPTCLPAKTEGIFVVKTPQKRVFPSFSRRRCQPSIP